MDYDRIVLMKGGQVLQMGPPQELLQDNFSNFRATYGYRCWDFNKLEFTYFKNLYMS